MVTASPSWPLRPDPDPLVTELAPRVRAQVAEQLTARLRAEQEAGRPLGVDDQRQLVRELVASVLEDEARAALTNGRPVLGLDQEEQIAREVLDSVFGLGRLQRLLDDPHIENINANGATEVFVRLADGTRQRVEPIAASDAELVELLRTAAARVGVTERRFDLGSPALNLRLPDGSRLFAVMGVTRRPCVAVRRHRYPRVTLRDEVELGTLTVGLRDLLAAIVKARRNVIVAGDIGAGKTTLLRALATEIIKHERLVTIEDTAELGLDQWPDMHPDVVAMESRDPNVEGAGEISQADLVRWALRMSPDRVIVGEVRGPELVPMLNAMSMGTNGSMCTLHAGASGEVFGKLATYAAQSAERLGLEATNLLVASAVHFVVYLDHDRATGQRVVSSVREVVGADGLQVVSNEVLRPRPGPDRHAIPAAPLRAQTMERLVREGLDPDVFGHPEMWSPPRPTRPHARQVPR